MIIHEVNDRPAIAISLSLSLRKKSRSGPSCSRGATGQESTKECSVSILFLQLLFAPRDWGCTAMRVVPPGLGTPPEKGTPPGPSPAAAFRRVVLSAWSIFCPRKGLDLNLQEIQAQALRLNAIFLGNAVRGARRMCPVRPVGEKKVSDPSTLAGQLSPPHRISYSE